MVSQIHQKLIWLKSSAIQQNFSEVSRMFGREERLAKLYHLVNFDKEVKTRCEYIYRIVNIRTIDVIDILHIIEYISPENKEGILPVATLSIAICSLPIYVSQRRCARGDNFLIGFININKYTSASENVHLCLRKSRQLGHISIATGSIPSLFCVISMMLTNIPSRYIADKNKLVSSVLMQYGTLLHQEIYSHPSF